MKSKPQPPNDPPGIVVLINDLMEIIIELPGDMLSRFEVILGGIVCFFIGHKYEYSHEDFAEMRNDVYEPRYSHIFQCRRCGNETWEYADNADR
jgi:hypothetical protein